MKKLYLILITAGFTCQIVYASMNQFLALNASACDKLIYINQVTQDTGTMASQDGEYLLDNWHGDDADDKDAYNYICYTNSKTSNLSISYLDGSADNLNNNTIAAWLSVNGIPQICSLSQSDFHGAFFEGSKGVENSCTSSIKFSGDSFYITPVTTVPSNWQTLTYTLAEWDYPDGDFNKRIVLPMTITRQYESSTPKQ